ncbi:D-alanyl-D-alanine carboxypeptidase/D-alanyl-D-alanine endopeptidase [Endozoicomonadaceae bacterium StTr2]
MKTVHFLYQTCQQVRQGCRCLLLFLMTFCASVQAELKPLPESLRKLLPPGATVAIEVHDLDNNRLLISENADRLMKPASLQKLLTGFAALNSLEDNFSFKTLLRAEPGAVGKSGIRDDLILEFSGDPTLTSRDIHQMFKTMAGNGLKHIDGNIWLDAHAFGGQAYGRGWSWDAVAICYSAPVDAAIIDRNCFNARLSNGKTADAPARLVTDNNVATFDIQVITRPDCNLRYELEVAPIGHNAYQLVGCLPPRTRNMPLRFALTKPVENARWHVLQALRKNGIRHTGELRLGTPPKSRTAVSVVAQNQSEPLEKLLARALKKSDNLAADALLKTLGKQMTHRPGTFQNGTVAMRKILEQQGIDLGNSYLADGSGLSHHNLITARTLRQLLLKAHTFPKARQFREALAVAAEDGTLRYHPGMRGNALKGKFKGKTGGMTGVRNLAGYLETGSGRHLAMVLMINGISDLPGKRGKSRAKLRKFEASLLTQLASLY